MLKRLEEIVSIKDETKKREMVAHFLETEGTTTDLEEDCRERIADLQGKECVILVAGAVYNITKTYPCNKQRILSFRNWKILAENF